MHYVCRLLFLLMVYSIPLSTMDFLGRLVNFYDCLVEVVYCSMPNSYYSASTALLVDNHIPDNLPFSLQTQTYTITPDQYLYVGVFQGHNSSRDQKQKSAAMNTAEWFNSGVKMNQDIEQIFEEIDEKALKEFSLQEGSTAAVCKLRMNNLAIYTIGNCRVICSQHQRTEDHDTANKKEYRRSKGFFRAANGALYVIASPDSPGVYQSYDFDKESEEQKGVRIKNTQKNPDYSGYTFLLRAFGHKMMRNVVGTNTKKDNIITSEVEANILPNNYRFVFIGNPGCFEYTENKTFAKSIEALLDKNVSLEEIGWRVLLYIWESKNSQDDETTIGKDLSLEEIKIELDHLRAKNQSCKASSFILCKKPRKSFRPFNQERKIVMLALLLLVLAKALYNQFFDIASSVALHPQA